MIEVKPDERWVRDGDNLIMDLPLSFSQAAFGMSITVPTPYGNEQVSVPSGTQGGTVLRLRGKGLPRLGQGGNGDVLIRTNVWTPESLTEEQAQLFQQLARVEGDPPKRQGGWWSKLKRSAGRVTWYSIEVHAAPDRRDAVAAWLVGRTGQAVEERADGTLVSFAARSGFGRCTREGSRCARTVRTSPWPTARSRRWTGPPPGAAASPRDGSAGSTSFLPGCGPTPGPASW